MARAPRPSEVAAKKAKKSKVKGAKPATSKRKPAPRRAAQHGGKVITREDILAAESLSKVPPNIKLPSMKYVHDFFLETLPKLDTEKDARVKDIRDAHKRASENRMDPKSTQIMRGLVKMPDSKLQVTMYHLMHAIEACGLWERALRQGQLDLEKAGAVEDEEGEDSEETKSEAATEQTEELPGTDGNKSPPLKLVDNQTTAEAMDEAIRKDTQAA